MDFQVLKLWSVVTGLKSSPASSGDYNGKLYDFSDVETVSGW